MDIFWEGGASQSGLVLGVISMHFRVFSEGQGYKMGLFFFFGGGGGVC